MSKTDSGPVSSSPMQEQTDAFLGVKDAGAVMLLEVDASPLSDMGSINERTDASDVADSQVSDQGPSDAGLSDSAMMSPTRYPSDCP